MSKFLVIVPRCRPGTGKKMQRYLDKRHVPWWHWSDDVWLLRFSEEKTTQGLRDEIMALLPKVNFLVMKFDDRQREWAGYGPEKWEEWFNTAWQGSGSKDQEHVK